jgi:hypothetical protein
MKRASIRSIVSTLGAILAFAASASSSVAASSNPYSSVPSVNDKVRFDGSAGGATKAWAYPNQASLEAYLRSTIDASFGSTSYDAYQSKMSSVLARSLEFPNGAQAVVSRVQQFSYRDHQDIEVQAQITSGSVHAIVWTTPADLVSTAGQRYLK